MDRILTWYVNRRREVYAVLCVLLIVAALFILIGSNHRAYLSCADEERIALSSLQGIAEMSEHKKGYEDIQEQFEQCLDDHTFLFAVNKIAYDLVGSIEK